MRRLNAIDAISPAFTRTHQLLFKPFRVGRSWKLATSQYLGLMGGFFVPVPLAGLYFLRRIPGARTGSAELLFAGALLLMTLLMFAFFYLGQRMQFVDFEMIVTREQFIAPMWRRYRGRSGPFLLAKTVGGTLLALLMTPVFLHFGRGLFGQFAAIPQATRGGAPQDPAVIFSFMGQIFLLYGLIFATFLIIKLFSTLLEDFVMPFYLVEALPFAASVSRGLGLWRDDPLGCVGYLLMKLLMSIVGFIGQYVSNLVVIIPLYLIGILVVVASLALRAALHPRPAGHVFFIVGGVVLYLVFLATMMWFQLGTLGYVFTFLQAYGMYFVGSRYPALGNLLEPPPPPLYGYAPPPSMPAPDEDDDGPDFPMDPALA